MTLNRKSGRALALNVGLAVGFALAANAAISVFGSPQGPEEPDEFPPGWIIGTVWTLLFAALGTARWLVAISTHRGREASISISIVALLLFCTAYPFYTGLLSNVNVGTVGNVATTVAALVVAVICWQSSRLAAFLVLLVACWTSYATVLTWREGTLWKSG